MTYSRWYDCRDRPVDHLGPGSGVHRRRGRQGRGPRLLFVCSGGRWFWQYAFGCGADPLCAGRVPGAGAHRRRQLRPQSHSHLPFVRLFSADASLGRTRGLERRPAAAPIGRHDGLRRRPRRRRRNSRSGWLDQSRSGARRGQSHPVPFSPTAPTPAPPSTAESVQKSRGHPPQAQRNN